MLIVHHWDTDGVCSAAKIVKVIGVEDYDNMTPEIGDFHFNDRILAAMKEHDEVYVLDLNLPDEMDRLDREAVFIDHHVQKRIPNKLIEQINPVMEGKDASGYPSCTVVISDHFHRWDLLSALGAIGDVGERALKHPGVRKELEKNNLTVEKARRIVSLIDSSYIAMDRDGVENAVGKVLKYSPEEMLDDPDWNRKLTGIENAIRDALGRRREVDGFAIIEFSSPFNIVSKIARSAVWDMGYRGALVVNNDFHGKGQTYFRIDPDLGEMVDMRSIIDKLGNIGASAGGKREVVGSVYPLELAERVLNVIRPHIFNERNRSRSG